MPRSSIFWNFWISSLRFIPILFNRKYAFNTAPNFFNLLLSLFLYSSLLPFNFYFFLHATSNRLWLLLQRLKTFNQIVCALSSNLCLLSLLFFFILAFFKVYVVCIGDLLDNLSPRKWSRRSCTISILKLIVGKHFESGLQEGLVRIEKVIIFGIRSVETHLSEHILHKFLLLSRICIIFANARLF